MKNFIKNKKTNEKIEFPPYKCKCCGIGDIDEEHDICKYCSWEDDGLQNESPDYDGGANKMSLNQHKQFWNENKDDVLKNLKTNPLYAIIKAKEYYKNNFEKKS